MSGALNSVNSFLGCFLSSLDGFLSLFLYSFDSFLYLLFDLRLFVGQLVELLCHDSSFGMTDAFCTEVVADDGADVSVCAYNSAPRTECGYLVTIVIRPVNESTTLVNNVAQS